MMNDQVFMKNIKRCPYCGRVMQFVSATENKRVMCSNHKCASYQSMTIEQNNRRPIEEQLEADKSVLCREIDRLQAVVKDALEFIEHENIDFSNGVLSEDGTDEGIVKGAQYFYRLRVSMYQVLHKPIPEVIMVD